MKTQLPNLSTGYPYRWAADRKWERRSPNENVWHVSSTDMAPTAITFFVVHMGNVGWQVWEINEPVSGYFKEFDDAAEEALILMAEAKLVKTKRPKAWNRQALKAAGAWSKGTAWED